jgi:insulysin
MRCRMQAVNQTFLQMEKWYGTKYFEEPISPRLLETWKTGSGIAIANKTFGFVNPPPNTYIPNNFTLHCKKPSGHLKWPKESPTLLIDSAGMRVWHKLDTIYGTPKVYIDIDMVSPIPSSSAYNQLLTMLFAQVFADTLQEKVYAFSLAGLYYDFVPTQTGMSLIVGGYGQHLEEYLELLLDTFVNLQVDSNQLGRLLDVTERALQNFQYEMPKGQAGIYRAVLRNALGYGAPELLGALYQSKLWGFGAHLETFANPSNERRVVDTRIVDAFVVASFIDEFKQKLFLEVLVHGNIDSVSAIRVAAKIRSIVQYKALSKAERPQNVIRQLNSSQVLMVMGGNPAESNAALSMTFMLGVSDTLDRLKLQLLDQSLSDALFKQLRTKEMIGYIVQGYPSSEAGVYWYTIIVQSSWKDPVYMRDRVRFFLRNYADKLKCDSADHLSDFNDTKTSLHDQLVTPYSSLAKLSDFYWDEIRSREYWWNRDVEKASLLKGISCEDLRTFWETNFMNPKTTRELSVMVFSHQQKTPIPTKSDMLVGNTTADSGDDLEHLHYIPSIAAFRAEHHDYYPQHIDWDVTSACPPIRGFSCTRVSVAPTSAMLSAPSTDSSKEQFLVNEDRLVRNSASAQ